MTHNFMPTLAYIQTSSLYVTFFPWGRSLQIFFCDCYLKVAAKFSEVRLFCWQSLQSEMIAMKLNFGYLKNTPDFVL